MVAKIDLKGMFPIWSKKPQRIKRFAISKLSSVAGLQKELTEVVATKNAEHGNEWHCQESNEPPCEMPER